MANDQPTNSSSKTNYKTLLLGAIAVVSSVIAVVLSQPHTAVASINGEVCLSDEKFADNQYPSLNPAKVLASTSQQLENQLFWNPLTKSWLTDEQAQLLNSAYEIGFADGGREHAEMLQAVLLQETIAGQLGRIGHMTARVGKRSYGVMQVKVSAARDVLKRNKEFGRFRSDEELIVALMTDDAFNIQIASKLLQYLTGKTKSAEAALVAYNIGLRASRKISEPDAFKYVVRTKRNLTEVVQHFNQKYIDTEIQVAMR